MTDRFDVVVVGGGIIGCCVAWFLKQLAPGLDVCVVEPDPAYAFASTVRASGGARRLFSCPENIAMSNFSIDFIRQFPMLMAIDNQPAAVDWVEGGYLFIVPPEGLEALRANTETQLAMGCDVELLSPDALKARFPSMYVGDLGGGVHSPHDGWCDPNSFLQGTRRKASAVGVTFRQERVSELVRNGAAITQIRLASGATLRADAVVVAAGAWSADLCATVALTLPVTPLRRFEHYFTCGHPVEFLPYVKDTARLAFRSEGKGFSGGLVNGDEPRGFNFEVDHNWFENVVWPAVAHRFPVFESAKCHRTWAGLYEQNELDGNPIIGRTDPENLYVVTGFSGHGMMHAPAAGRGIAELIVLGQYQSIDLARLGYARIRSGTPYPERGIL